MQTSALYHTVLRDCNCIMENKLIPDVSGFRLEQASKLLTSIGIEKLTVHTTAPPRTRNGGYDGDSRVIRQTMATDDSIELLVCNVPDK